MALSAHDPPIEDGRRSKGSGRSLGRSPELVAAMSTPNPMGRR